MLQNIQDVRTAFDQGKELQTLFFWGHTPSKDGNISASCLSQWWMSDFIIEGIKYTSAEQYMMAGKAMLFKDDGVFKEIVATHDPKTVKALGRKVKNFDDNEWKAKRFEIVTKGNIAKFSQNPDLKKFLLATGDKILVEASPFDRIWGIGLSKANENIENPNSWRGQNLLGFALMKAREEIVKT